MEMTGGGTAIMIAIAATLWFAYFVPTWMRRREYLDTERTATRLQQTLRVMAETAELPEQVRVEVSARDAARHERALRAAQRRADARLARHAAPHRPIDAATAVRLRRRRAHRLATLLMVAATVTIGVQLVLTATTGVVPGSWLVFGAGAVLGVAGVAVRRRLDAPSAPAPVARPRAATAAETAEAAAPVRRASGWTPVPVPKPLYLSRPPAEPVQPSLDLAAQLREASLESERALRAAQAAPEVVPIRPAAPPSRWAAMGRVEAPDAAAPDLDEVLRRRRNAG